MNNKKEKLWDVGKASDRPQSIDEKKGLKYKHRTLLLPFNEDGFQLLKKFTTPTPTLQPAKN